MQKAILAAQCAGLFLLGIGTSLVCSFILIAIVGRVNEWDVPGAGLIIIFDMLIALGTGGLFGVLCAGPLWTYSGRPDRLHLFLANLVASILMMVGSDVLLPALLLPLTGPRTPRRFLESGLAALLLEAGAVWLIVLGARRSNAIRLSATPSEIPAYLRYRPK